MGLFTQQPEENDEWAGIPSEPLRPETEAERLTDAATLDAATLGIGGIGAFSTVKSIVIPVAPAVETADGQESADPE